MSTIKNLARVGSLAGEGQRKEAWTQMMRPSEEAMEGIGAWREKREVDWIGWKSKL
jgi:1,4-dihydroxy-2-naphthoyl-CoA synthase